MSADTGRAGQWLAHAARLILADIDAPGHTIRSIRPDSIIQLRAALAEWNAHPTDPANLARSQRRDPQADKR